MKSILIADKVMAIAKKHGWEPNPRPTSLEFMKERMYFRHKFAKALWGVEYKRISESTSVLQGSAHPQELKNYQYHLQQMVLSDNPMDYLTKFVDHEQNSESTKST